MKGGIEKDKESRVGAEEGAVAYCVHARILYDRPRQLMCACLCLCWLLLFICPCLFVCEVSLLLKRDGAGTVCVFVFTIYFPLFLIIHDTRQE